MRHPNLPQVLHILDRLTVTKNDAWINLKEKKSILELELERCNCFKSVILSMAETNLNIVIEKIWSNACPEHCRTSRISKP